MRSVRYAIQTLVVRKLALTPCFLCQGHWLLLLTMESGCALGLCLVALMLCRGYTRKEPFANGIWTPKAENWNGRTAMLGFTGIVLTEALAGKTVLQV